MNNLESKRMSRLLFHFEAWLENVIADIVYKYCNKTSFLFGAIWVSYTKINKRNKPAAFCNYS